MDSVIIGVNLEISNHREELFIKALREGPQRLVIVATSHTEFALECAKTAFCTGHEVELITDEARAAHATRWLTDSDLFK